MQSVLEAYPGSYCRELVSTATPGWSVFNPSIAKGPEGYRCIVRSSNFVLRNGEYLVNDPENIVRTVNYLADLDDNLNLINMEPIDDSWVDPPVHYTLVRNMEDARLFWHDNSWWVSGTSRQHRSDGVPKIAVDKLRDYTAIERQILKDDDDVCEKNWMPIADTGQWVYSVSPSIIMHDGGFLSTDPSSDLPSNLRGSSQLVPWKDGYLGVTHEVTWEPTRYYWHRFVYFDSRGFAVSATEPFYFLSPGIEFANGITLWNDKVIVSFGHADERALLAVIPGELI